MNTVLDLEAVTKAVRGQLKKDFSPYARYDKHLDCIRVHIQDCSVVEERLSSIFTIHKAAHADYDQEVGFTIKGVRHLFEVLNLEAAENGVYLIADIISNITKKYPDTMVKRVHETFHQVIANGLKVNMSMEDIQAA